MIFKKLLWAIKRHPFLYLTRFRLLSKNSNLDEIDRFNYNALNPKAEIPEYFNEVNARIFKDGVPTTDFELVKQLSRWLKINIKGGPGLSEPSEQALHTMLSGKGGVCSDIAQIFNNFCVVNGIRVREWGTTSAPFNREFGGHSFNEVFCREMDKWVLIDVSYNLVFYGEDALPLSVVEMYQLLRAEQPVRYETLSAEGFVDAKIIDRNYLNTGITPFLICDYRNKTYDAFLKRTHPYIPVFITHFAVYVMRRSYHYRFPLDDYRGIFSKASSL